MKRITAPFPLRMRTIALSCTAALVFGPQGVSPALADIQSDMSDMFKSAGVMGNVTPPNVYQSQNSSIATLGSIQIRQPTQNSQIFSFQNPTLKAGCGGVDLRLGSMSWINAQQFKQMMEAVGNNTVGLLFSAAMSMISPLIGGKIEMLLKQVQDASNFFSNSCRDAEMLLDGFSGKKTADTYNACMKVQRLVSQDEESARAACQDQAPSINAQAASDNDPDIRAAAQRDINIMWDALKKTNLTHDEREMYMNIAGTVIVHAKTANGTADANTTIPSVVKDIKLLENGNALPPAGSNPGDVAIAGWWSCDEVNDPDCLNPTNTTVKVITPFAQQAYNAMNNLLTALWSNAYPQVSDMNFVNYSSLPVGMMLRVGYMSGRDDLAHALMNQYSSIIGYDFAYNFLNKSIQDARVYLSNGSNRRGIEDDEVKGMFSRMDSMLNQIDAQRHIVATDQIGMNQMVSSIVETEKQMYATLPQGLQNMLMFSNHMSALRGR